MKARELNNMGIPAGPATKAALAAVAAARAAGLDVATIRARIRALAEGRAAGAAGGPSASVGADDPIFGDLARAHGQGSASYVERPEPAPYRRWGADLDADSIRQIENACRLPIAARGALMPDAHVGYGLPIGGVLGTRNAVIPYAVGVDIACRVKMTVLDIPPERLDSAPRGFEGVLESQTRFGIGASFERRRSHAVMDEDWSVSSVTRTHRDKAWAQLGTSGSGNHFVEFGVLTVPEAPPGDAPGDVPVRGASLGGAAPLGLPAGGYLALLSHSGSRGTGSAVANHFSRLAMRAHPDLPRELRHLAWLDLDSGEGQEYWAAMELMGRYAAANHACIHRHIARALGAEVLLDLENHHNFAWKEEHFGETLVVHRKGATPAARGVIGVIPGSMAAPTYIVRGKGHAASLDSAAHGAGRRISRTAARQTYSWKAAREVLERGGVRVLSAGVDEVPMVYKDIEEVMAAQEDLVERLASFFPRIVKMAPGDEPAED